MPRLAINADDVFEGVGTRYAGQPLIAKLPPAPAPPVTCTFSSDAAPQQAPWDRSEALRQLKRAVHVDVPPQLVHVVPAYRETPPQAAPQLSVDGGVHSVPSLSAVLPTTSARVEALLASLESECLTVQNWLGGSGSASATTDSVASYTDLLLNVGGCQELLSRVRGLAREQRYWEQTREHIAEELARGRSAACASEHVEGVESTARVIASARQCIGVTHSSAEVGRRVTALLHRYRTLAPAITEAVLRKRCLREMGQSSSPDFQRSLCALNDAMEAFQHEMEASQKRVESNVVALQHRCDDVRRRVNRVE